VKVAPVALVEAPKDRLELGCLLLLALELAVDVGDALVELGLALEQIAD